VRLLLPGDESHSKRVEFTLFALTLGGVLLAALAVL
jgi:hypothetical protein